MDMQEFTCGEKWLYPNGAHLVQEINKIIVEARKQGQRIVFIRQEFQWFDFIFCLILMGGRFLHGLARTSLCSDLDNTGEIVFVKHQHDAFTSKELNTYLTENSVDTVSIVGLDAASCVYKTAVGAVNRGL